MPITVSDKIKLNKAEPSIDSRYGPYTSVEAAYEDLGPEGANLICIGLTVGIQASADSAIVEYWFKEGTELADLVIKQSEVDLSDYYNKSEIDTGFVNSTTYDSMKTQVDEMAATLEELTYVAPTISAFSATPSFGVKEVGSTVSVTAASISITKGSKEFTSLSVKNGNTVLSSITSGIIEGANSLAVSLSVPTDSVGSTVLTAELSDGKSTITKTGTYSIVYPYYYGVLDSASSVSADTVVALTKSVEAKGNKTKSFDLSSKVAVMAYPASYGTLSVIKDQNNFDVTSTFINSTISINSVSYYVYVLENPSNVGSFSYTFSY